MGSVVGGVSVGGAVAGAACVGSGVDAGAPEGAWVGSATGAAERDGAVQAVTIATMRNLRPTVVSTVGTLRFAEVVIRDS